MQAPPERFTLKQVADSIRKTIESRYNRTYWVTAEMHKLNPTKKGHCYPELVQKENDRIVVEMRGTIWKNQFESIQKRFTEIVREPLRDGLELLFQVRIVYHPIYNLGLEIIDIDPNYSLGALQRERQETLEKLNREGILNANQQLKMAMLPKRLAVISQADSKGYSDFSLLLNGHPKKYHFHTFLFEATLQGDDAVKSITAQLQRIRKVISHFDAVVIIRGGGGEIGMHCYNNYELAKAIATFPIPVLTGIGHSTNMTVCEMIAYNNGITPSDLAYYFLRIFEELDEPLDHARRLLPEQIRQLLGKYSAAFAQTTQLFRQQTRQTLLEHRSDAASLIKDFQRITQLSLRDQHNATETLTNRLKSVTAQQTQHHFAQIDQQRSTLGIFSKHILENALQSTDRSALQLQQQLAPFIQRERTKLESAGQNLRLVDPIHVLRRGYAIVTNDHGLISRENLPEPGSSIRVVQSEVEMTATIKTVKSGND